MDKGQINYKTRLEKKLCLAKEIPEPIFDVSDCNLKTIPSNVFILCKVLRKEALYLQKNYLSELNSGGLLSDLKCIKLLDISSNKFSRLPREINELENLEVLNVSNNQLVDLPETIGSFRNLVLLNLSYNNLQEITDQIGYCTNLEVLDLTHNEPLKRLPDSLGRINTLRQLELDSGIIYPPQNVCSKGIQEIMKFLSKNIKEDTQLPSTSKPKRTLTSYESLQEKIELHEKLKLEKQNERLRLEKEIWEQNQKEVKMQQKLQDGKKKLVEDVKSKQEFLDAELVKLQEQKNADRALLIKLCQEEEKKAAEICRIVHSRKNQSLQFSAKWEKERKEEEELLFTHTSQSKTLEKKAILASMEVLLKEEVLRVQRDNISKQILASQSLVSELASQNKAQEYLKKRDQSIAALKDTIRQDEELQKSAVASLLEKSDAASWELAQQVAIIEAQLAELTRLELSKRKLESEHQITELSNSRVALAQILVDLLAQQDERRKALINTIRRMESMKESAKDSSNFWMEQYEKLLKSKCHQMVQFLEAVNPKLVYELFVNGVFHFLPLLKDVVLSVQTLETLNLDALGELGVKNPEDRRKILSAVRSYLIHLNRRDYAPSAPSLHSLTMPLSGSFNAPSSRTTSYLASDECVICLEKKPDVVFVPCGHICCCFKCFMGIALCPLCRKPIDSAHKKIDNSLL